MYFFESILFRIDLFLFIFGLKSYHNFYLLCVFCTLHALSTCMLLACVVFVLPPSSNKEESHSQIPETRTPSTNLHSSENLPSTERSESIIHLKRSKSESSICKPAIASLESPWDEPLCLKGSAKLSSRLGPESPSREASAPLVDNTLSSQTGFEEDDEAPKAEGSRTGKGCFYAQFH